jgi:hypothetical protein
MSAFKSLTSQDVIITPFVVNKSFSFVGSASLNEDNVFIERLLGKNITGSFEITTEPTTGTTASSGFTSSYYQRDIYNSVKQLYYSNELPNPEGTYIVTDLNGNIVEDNTNTNVHSRFDNYLQTTLQSGSRHLFPTESNHKVAVLSIPSQLYGDYINPSTFALDFRYLPSASSVNASLNYSVWDKNSFNNKPLLNGSGSIPITWNINENELNWFNSGALFVPVDEYVEPYDIFISASFAPQISSYYVSSSYLTSGYVTQITASNVTLSLAIDNGGGSYTILASGSASLQPTTPTTINLSALELSYSGSKLVLLPQFDAADPSIATVIADVSYIVLANQLGNVFLRDDGNGNLYDTSFNNSYEGIIVYSHGLVVITNQGLLNFWPSTDDVNVSFQSSRLIYETQYKCTIRENEFNYSLNPSIISSSGTWTNPLNSSCSLDLRGQVYDFVTGSVFAPYVTTVGLYNENQELLAVAKLSQPLPTSRTTDTSILINIDR